MFLYDTFRAIRSVTGKSIPVYCFQSLYAAPTIRIFGPEKLGGFGNTQAKARIQIEATGRKMEDVLDEVGRPVLTPIVSNNLTLDIPYAGRGHREIAWTITSV